MSSNGEQVSELAEEQEIRDLFERFGRVTRVFLARDRETQRAKGFAFISFADRSDAARACDKMDGCMLPSFSFCCSQTQFSSERDFSTDNSLQSVIATSFCVSSLPRGPLRFLISSALRNLISFRNILSWGLLFCFMYSGFTTLFRFQGRVCLGGFLTLRPHTYSFLTSFFPNKSVMIRSIGVI